MVLRLLIFQYGRIPMNKQLEYFANTKAQIIAQLGEQAGNELISSALYSSNLGSNDYLNNYYQPLSPVGNLTSTQLATLLINTYRGQLTVHLLSPESASTLARYTSNQCLLLRVKLLINDITMRRNCTTWELGRLLCRR